VVTHTGPAAIPLLRHGDPRVRLASFRAVQSLYGNEFPPDARAALPALASDDDPQIRATVAGALPQDGAWQHLLQGLGNDPDPAVQAAAFSTAARAPAGERLLREGLMSPDASRRQLAANALSFVETTDEIVAQLLTMARSQEREERLAALTALGNSDNPDARAALRSAAEDGDAAVRTLAANALSPTVEGEDALLLRLGRDRDGAVRAAALARLSASVTDRTRPALLDALADPLEAVRLAAAHALLDTVDAELLRAAVAYMKQAGAGVLSIKLPYRVAADQIDLYVSLLADVDAASRGGIMAGLARSIGVSDEDVRILSRDFDALPPYLDPYEPVSEERLADVAEVLGTDVDGARARYRAIAEGVGIMVPNWA